MSAIDARPYLLYGYLVSRALFQGVGESTNGSIAASFPSQLLYAVFRGITPCAVEFGVVEVVKDIPSRENMSFIKSVKELLAMDSSS
jgi:hypothetical protein